MSDTTDYHDFTWPDMPIELRKKLNTGPIYINAIRCKECEYFVRSRNQHDFRTCKCGSSAVDGGSFYTKVMGDPEIITVMFTERDK